MKRETNVSSVAAISNREFGEKFGMEGAFLAFRNPAVPLFDPIKIFTH
jgi:hypothetical protein